MTSPEIKRLARRLDSLERQARQRKLPTLGHSSIDGGALQANDDDGVLTLIVGQQFDGTNTAAVVTGPPPPQPLLPLLTVQAGTLRIFWDGTFTNGDVAPMDFARVLAYAAPSAGFSTPDPLDHTQIVGQFTSATGGEITAALEPGVEYAVYLVAWTQAGKFGAASEVALGTPGALPDGEAIEAALAEKSAVYRGTTPPWENGDPTKVDNGGDMWFDTTLQPGPMVGLTDWSATGGLVTLTTSGEHGIVAGKTIATVGIEPGIDGQTHVVASAPDAFTLTFPYAIADTPVTPVDGATVQGQDIEPLNRPHIWDGDSWVDMQDHGIADALTLVNNAAVQVSTHGAEIEQTQEELATLQVTANDAYNQAYAADGRVSISDYEPTGADVAGKQDGSLWITRTRDRTNASTNPSFELSLLDWEVVGGTKTRVPVAPAGDGAWAMEVNSSAASYAVWDREGVREPCQAGQTITTSAYLRLVSGLGTGTYASLVFYDSLGASLGEYVGDGLDPDAPVTVTADLNTTDWLRVFARWAAPEGAATYETRFHNPNAGDVWQIDAHMSEVSALVGRYFDGDSEGGSWIVEDGDHLSASILDGNAIIRLFTLEDSNWAEKFWTADTIISVNASTIDRGAMNGGFLADGTVPVDKAYMPDVVASEAIDAGDLVSIYNAGGVPTMRKATAADRLREANGFVLIPVPIGGRAPVYTGGYNPLLSDLTPGTSFLSTEPGKVSSTPPQDIGTIVQRVGNAVDPTTLDFAPTMTVALT